MNDNRNPDVDAWFEGYANPQKALVEAVRPVILDTDPAGHGNDQVAGADLHVPREHRVLLPEVEGARVLMFHTGASLPDPTGLLEGEGQTSRVVRFLDQADLAAKTEALRGLVAAWIEVKGPAKKAAKKS